VKRLLAVSAFVAIGLVALPALSHQRPAMTAHFIDVGQAHATFLEFPCGAMLIDAGTQDDEHESKLLDYLNAFLSKRPSSCSLATAARRKGGRLTRT
jgi:beta-lactamase superfamily II metal-dependent hydrolase